MSNSDYSTDSEDECLTMFIEEHTEETIVNIESITNDDLNAEEKLNDEWCKFKNDYQNMTKSELLDIIQKDKKKKREYIQKYQKTPNGRVKTRQASKNYYDANRIKILAKKKAAYLKKKNKNN